jgi:hypothetical protein
MWGSCRIVCLYTHPPSFRTEQPLVVDGLQCVRMFAAVSPIRHGEVTRGLIVVIYTVLFL